MSKKKIITPETEGEGDEIKINKKLHVAIISFCLICITAALIIHFSPGERQKRHISKGEEFLKTEDLEGAKKEAEKALEINTKNPMAFLLLGKIYIKENEYVPALDNLKKAEQLMPDYMEISYYSAIALKKEKKFSEALQYLKKADELNKERNEKWEKQIVSEKVKVYIENAGVLYNMGNIREGEEEIQKALAIDPENGETHYELALLYISLDRPDLALEECKTTIGLRPGLGADAFYKLIKAWKEKAIREESLENYKNYYRKLKEMAEEETDIIKKELLIKIKLFAEEELKNIQSGK